MLIPSFLRPTAPSAVSACKCADSPELHTAMKNMTYTCACIHVGAAKVARSRKHVGDGLNAALHEVHLGGNICSGLLARRPISIHSFVIYRTRAGGILPIIRCVGHDNCSAFDGTRKERMRLRTIIYDSSICILM